MTVAVAFHNDTGGADLLSITGRVQVNGHFGPGRNRFGTQELHAILGDAHAVGGQGELSRLRLNRDGLKGAGRIKFAGAHYGV